MGGLDDLRRLFSDWGRARSRLSAATLRRGLETLRLDRDDLAGYIAFHEQTYQRVAIERCDWFDALLLCWRSGQASPVHDHGGSTCGFQVVAGQATETTFARAPCGAVVPGFSRRLNAGEVSVTRDSAIHQLGNLAGPGEDLITLHVYSPPLAASRVIALGETSLAALAARAPRRPPDLTRLLRVEDAQVAPPRTPRRARKVMV
jgi:cysteine dioxygenase